MTAKSFPRFMSGFSKIKEIANTISGDRQFLLALILTSVPIFVFVKNFIGVDEFADQAISA